MLEHSPGPFNFCDICGDSCSPLSHEARSMLLHLLTMPHGMERLMRRQGIRDTLLFLNKVPQVSLEFVMRLYVHGEFSLEASTGEEETLGQDELLDILANALGLDAERIERLYRAWVLPRAAA